jgi:hypothetical protein
MVSCLDISGSSQRSRDRRKDKPTIPHEGLRGNGFFSARGGEYE